MGRLESDQDKFFYDFVLGIMCRPTTGCAGSMRLSI
jgi:hypothetical protein